MAISERLTFLVGFIRDRRAVGSVTPSSASLSRAIASYVGAERRYAIAELGAGTGPITRALLERMPAEGRLWAFEVNPAFAEVLRQRIDDPRLIVVEASADEAPRIAREAGLEGFDAVVSAIPYSLLGDAGSRSLLANVARSMRPGAPLVALQYHLRFLPPILRGLFGSLERRFFLWNVPPAMLLRVHASSERTQV